MKIFRHPYTPEIYGLALCVFGVIIIFSIFFFFSFYIYWMRLPLSMGSTHRVEWIPKTMPSHIQTNIHSKGSFCIHCSTPYEIVYCVIHNKNTILFSSSFNYAYSVVEKCFWYVLLLDWCWDGKHSGISFCLYIDFIHWFFETHSMAVHRPIYAGLLSNRFISSAIELEFPF